jgi:hypothetical protein
MKIELNKTIQEGFSSPASSNMVISHLDKVIKIPNAVALAMTEGEIGLIFPEINAHWARRSDNNQTAIFQLYEAMVNCISNYPHLADVNDREGMVIESLRPFVVRLLQLHRLDRMQNFWDNTYSDEMLMDFMRAPPPGVTADQMYTLNEYRDLQVFMICMRTLSPIIFLLQSTIMNNGARQYSRSDLYKELARSLISPHMEIVRSEAMNKIQRYVGEMVKGVPMRRARGIEVHDLLPGLLFSRMAKAPISLTKPSSFVVNMHTYVRQRISAENRTPEEREQSLDAMDKVLKMKDEYRFDFFVPLPVGNIHHFTDFSARRDEEQ